MTPSTPGAAPDGGDAERGAGSSHGGGGAASGPGATAPSPASSPADQELRDEIIRTLRTCYDPEIPVDIYELGLIYRVDVLEGGKIEIDMTLTSPNCPAAQSLPAEVETKVRGTGGVADVKLEIVWEPPWGPEKMSEVARLQLGFPG